jgi:carbonic anhydrase/acetyltransferase-like protein (isoleucine patch superfamily)
VPNGTIIEPRTVVAGVPARVLRRATEEEWESNKTHAEGYAELAAKYKTLL